LFAQATESACTPGSPIEHEREMTLEIWHWPWLIAFYLVGSIPTGYLLGKSRGLDIRQHGSGNIGATNVWRVMGRNWGLLAFAADFLKGFLPLYLVQRNFHADGEIGTDSFVLVACGLAAVIGHNYTPWLGFKGGKGIATSAGVLAALIPPVLGVALSLWIVATLATRTVSIGSILAAASLAPLAWYFYPGNWIYFGLACLAGLLAILRHRSNIQRLLAGTEPRIEFGSKKKSAP
jgi:glycerol-3-phosphate acyltransferase PlsY